MKMRIKPDHGYWDTTDYPIGGAFRRTGADGLVVEVTRKYEPTAASRYCDRNGKLADGRTVAFSTRDAEDVK